ncbi:MAG: hypothetical protein ACI4KA_11190 [Oscillospiraceae bacterium]
MPLPLILGIAAGVTGAAGVGGSIYGGVKTKKAYDVMKITSEQHKANVAKFEEDNKKASKIMDKLGTQELEILKSFERFSDMLERIQNRPQFKEININGVVLPAYNPQELKKVSVGAGVLLGGLSGAALGTAGGIAAAGATTAVVMAFGTSSTGTAIATLSGVAATKATLAALGGGAIAVGGGGVALGTTMLGVSTLGVGLLVGGVIFGITGAKLSTKVDEARVQMLEAKKKIDAICEHLKYLSYAAKDYIETLDGINDIYKRHLYSLIHMVSDLEKTDWLTYSDEEKKLVENTGLLVGLLYSMCKVQLVIKADTPNGINKVNMLDIRKAKNEATVVLHDCHINAE